VLQRDALSVNHGEAVIRRLFVAVVEGSLSDVASAVGATSQLRPGLDRVVTLRYVLSFFAKPRLAADFIRLFPSRQAPVRAEDCAPPF
jgi:hypothetical protein